MQNVPFIVVIPARLQSTRLPEKVLAEIDGKPMVIHVAHRAQMAGAQRTIIATDSPRIIDCARQYGIEAMMTAEYHACGTDRLAELARSLNWDMEQIVVNVQGDEPLIDPALIRQTANHLAAHPHCALSSAAHPITDLGDIFNPNIVKVVLNVKGHALYFSRAPIPWARDAWQDRMKEGRLSTLANESKEALASIQNTGPVYRHIGLYAYRAAFLHRFMTLARAPLEEVEELEQLRALWHGESIAIHVTHEAPMGGVDTASDLERVRALFHA